MSVETNDRRQQQWRRRRVCLSCGVIIIVGGGEFWRSMNTVNAGDHFYNFDSEENAAKWKGVLIAALRRVSVVKRDRGKTKERGRLWAVK